MHNLEEETPLPIEVMPAIREARCKLVVYIIYLAITTMPVLIGVFFWWYLHSIWIGFLMFLFFVLASGIVVSKMRVNSIPFNQRELNYSTIAVVKWYVGKNICFKER